MSNFKTKIPVYAQSLLDDDSPYDALDFGEPLCTIVDAINIAVIKTADPITLRFLLHLGGFTKSELQPAYDFVVATAKTKLVKEFQRAGFHHCEENNYVEHLDTKNHRTSDTMKS